MSKEIAVSPGSQQLMGNITPLEQWAHSLTITTPRQFEDAAEQLKAVKTTRQKVVDFFADSKAKAHATWKSLVASEKAFTDRLDVVESIVKRELMDYQRIENEKAEKERLRLQAIQDETARKERERLEKEAAKLKTPELKAQRLEQAAQVIAPVIRVPSAAPEVKGISTRKAWKGKVTDKTALIMYIANTNRMLSYLVDVNDSELNKFASSTKGSQPLPGVEWYEQTIMAAGGR